MASAVSGLDRKELGPSGEQQARLKCDRWAPNAGHVHRGPELRCDKSSKHRKPGSFRGGHVQVRFVETSQLPRVTRKVVSVVDDQSRDKVSSEAVDSKGNEKPSQKLLPLNLRLQQVWKQWSPQSGAGSTRLSTKVPISVPPYFQHRSKAMETHISYLFKIK